jgi:hypothetical protein
VLAACEAIQHSEIPEQSALFQKMFDQSNIQYFGGRLPDYKVLVVYDVWYWETERCGYPPTDPAPDAYCFIDFSGRQIFIRFLAYNTGGCSMEEFLLHEMTHAAYKPKAKCKIGMHPEMADYPIVAMKPL